MIDTAEQAGTGTNTRTGTPTNTRTETGTPRRDSGETSEVLGRLRAIDPESLDGPGVRAALGDVRRLRAWLDGVEAAVLRAGERSGAFRAAGAVDAAAFLAGEMGWSGRQARTRADTAAALAQLPATAAALSEGTITFEHASAVAKAAAAHDAHREAIAKCEAKLVAAAASTPVDRFRTDVRMFCDAVDADGGLARQERLRSRRQVSSRVRGDGMGVTVVELAPDDHAYLSCAIGTIAEELWRADHPDHDGPLPLVERTNRQRMADATVEMARRALGARVSDAREARPVIVAAVELDELRATLGARGLLPSIGPLPAATLVRLACDADVLPEVFDGAGEAVALGRTRRLPSRALRRALVARDHRCRFPGCDRPHAWCQAHHIVAWTDGGPTDASNLILLCSAHHHLVHEGGWHLTGPASSITVRRPDGDVVARDLGPPRPFGDPHPGPDPPDPDVPDRDPPEAGPDPPGHDDHDRRRTGVSGTGPLDRDSSERSRVAPRVA